MLCRRPLPCLLLLAGRAAAAAQLRGRGQQSELQPAATELFRAALFGGPNIAAITNPCSDSDYFADCDPSLDRIKVVPVPKPTKPFNGTALVKVMASSVNPHDWIDMSRSLTPHITLGLDLAGVVEAAEAPCAFQAGDQVWGTGFENAHAEYAIVPCENLGRKPQSLTMVEAASLPTVALADMLGLQKAGAPWSRMKSRGGFGPNVFINGGAGGTGLTAIQLAKQLGAGRVITTCSPSHFDLVRKMGADHVFDYHEANWWDVFPNGSIDIMYDCTPKEGNAERAFEVLANGGQYVTLQQNSIPGKEPVLQRSTANRTVTAQFLVVQTERGTEHLDKVREFVDSARLVPVIDSVYPLVNITEAFKRSMSRHAAGKVMINMVEPTSIDP